MFSNGTFTTLNRFILNLTKSIGLKSHPAHELVKRQCTGFSGMVSAVLKGNLDSTTKFLQSLKVCFFS